MRNRSYCLVSLGIIWTTLMFANGCAGSSSDIAAPSALEGLINVVDFSIPAGQTMRVNTMAKVIASHNISIEGTLEIAPGAELSLSSTNELSISGKIIPAPNGVPRANSIARGEGEPTVVLEANTIVLRDGAELISRPGQDLCLGFSSEDRGLAIDAGSKVSAGDGRDGINGAMGDDLNGKNGGNIEIGTGVAIAAIRERFPDQSTAQAPYIVHVIGEIRGGDGGKGGQDTHGERVGKSVTGLGGVAGKGGNIAIVAGYQIKLIDSGSIKAGDGGTGGGCGLPDAYIRAVDGTAALETGGSLTMYGTNGGNPGKTLIKAPKIDNPTGKQIEDGHGGQAGSFWGAAGNGGPGAPGGDTFINVGSPGENPIVPNQTLVTASLENGGNGGNAQDSSQNGGKGGIVSVLSKGVVATHLDSLATTNYSNGGTGFSGCSALSPSNGTKGGDGGDLAISTAMTVLSFSFLPECWRGGDGGDGVIPGKGGLGGVDEKSRVKIGKDGKDGSPCGGGGIFESQKFYPLVPGTQFNWVYTYNGVPTEFSQLIKPMGVFPGTTIQVFPFENFQGTGAPYGHSYSKNGPSGVMEFGNDYVGTDGKPTYTNRYDPPLTVPEGAEIGHDYVQECTQWEVDSSGTQSKSITVTTTLNSFGSVTVPYGTFSGAAKVSRTIKQGDTTLQSLVMWFVPNVGLVKLDETKSGSTQELKSVKNP